LRFFILLHLFGFGILLLFTAGGFDLLIFGWELVGITSVLLIAFFHYRAEPVRNALRVFAIYRLCDIGLLIGVFIIHHAVDSTSFNTLFPAAWPASSSLLTGSAATIVGFLLLFAAMGKAAQSPFSGWLPRAMEGPTPSSAIFYGALSVHAGAYLLLRAQPIISAAPLVSAAVILVGLLTAINGTMMCRISADAKTSLAYAAMTQLGIIFVEIGLGWRWFALLHITGHSVVRTLQFLRAPSMLHDFHRVHSAAGGHLEKKGAQYDLLLSFSAQRWLYRLALDHCHTDTILDRFAVGAIIRFAQILYKFETNWLNYAFRPNKNQPRSLADKVELIAVNQTREGIDVY
jgi:NAD(P)H-quinone oxidoreductase subunit 5